jgi:hypothetical protein
VSAKKAKICRRCGISKPLEEFYPTYQHGKSYRRSRCKSCDNELRRSRPRAKATEQQRELWGRRDAARKRKHRKERDHDAKHIYWDSRQTDRKRGFTNDLTKEFIAEQITKGCCYCGETELRMTLDRVDNERGHTTDNVVPACIRCNYVRGKMPFEAWGVIAQAMKRATKQGLFGDWTGRAR